MKKAIFMAAMLVCASAFATGPSNNNGDTTNNTTNNNQTYNQGGTGGQGGTGYGGNATAGAVAGAAAINHNDIRNTNQQAQGQQQGQAQGQSQSVKNSGNSSSSSGVLASGNSSSNSGGNTQSNAGNNAVVSVGGDTYEAARIPVATAYAPSIAPTAPCMGSTSGGIQGMSIGISVGSTWTDTNCVLLEQVRAVSNLGDKETATEMMMDIPAYAAAKKRLADRKAGKAPSAVSSEQAWDAKAKTASYDGPDEIIRARMHLPPLAGK